MNMIMAGIQIVLGLYVLLGGVIKLLRVPFQVVHWELYQYPMWTMTLVGIVEVLAAAGLIGGLGDRRLAGLAAAVLVVMMAGAIYTHLFQARQPVVTIIPASLCFLLALVVISGSWPWVSGP
ncbi:DoxX family protein [Paenibacillus oceani]|uniref:DoxX family protein n=1 Tax=Paenibacillus oceani TaxID=2772510 RepID=A0A927H1X7_9BACL|nr:DoxX family protein [Paenibacillus oceani]MBD2865220.1 DoxX family protein [Paenibacillus oceani]